MNENRIDASRQGRASVWKLARQLREETERRRLGGARDGGVMRVVGGRWGLGVAIASSPRKAF